VVIQIECFSKDMSGFFETLPTPQTLPLFTLVIHGLFECQFQFYSTLRISYYRAEGLKKTRCMWSWSEIRSSCCRRLGY